MLVENSFLFITHILLLSWYAFKRCIFIYVAHSTEVAITHRKTHIIITVIVDNEMVFITFFFHLSRVLWSCFSAVALGFCLAKMSKWNNKMTKISQICVSASDDWNTYITCWWNNTEEIIGRWKDFWFLFCSNMPFYCFYSKRCFFDRIPARNIMGLHRRSNWLFYWEN